MKRYVLGKHISTHATAAEFMQHVKSLVISNAVIADSTAVPDFKLNIKGEKTTIYCHRAEKLITVDEISLLAEEYKLEKEALYQLFTKRSYRINNANGEQVNAKPKRTRQAKPRSTQKEKDAHLESGQPGSDSGRNQLFQP